jgi:CBS domain-containing protein
MAGMDGHTALNEIKKINPETQVIILTGYGTKYSAMRAFVREAFDYLAKPCDVDILASRIQDAYCAKHQGYKLDSKKAVHIMTRISELIQVSSDIPVIEALEKMSLTAPDIKKTTDVLMVFDKRNILTGVLTRMDVIRAVRPEYVSNKEFSNEDSAKFSSIFWSGFFSDRVTAISHKKVGEIMSERPPVISENANLLEVAHLMWKESKRLLLVQDISKVIGLIRDKDIFHEITNVMAK